MNNKYTPDLCYNFIICLSKNNIRTHIFSHFILVEFHLDILHRLRLIFALVEMRVEKRGDISRFDQLIQHRVIWFPHKSCKKKGKKISCKNHPKQFLLPHLSLHARALNVKSILRIFEPLKKCLHIIGCNTFRHL